MYEMIIFATVLDNF